MNKPSPQALAVVKQELLAFAQQRKMQFEDGEPFHFHSLASAEEATALVEAAEQEVTDIRDQVGERRRGGVYLRMYVKRKLVLALRFLVFERTPKSQGFAETVLHSGAFRETFPQIGLSLQLVSSIGAQKWKLPPKLNSCIQSPFTLSRAGLEFGWSRQHFYYDVSSNGLAPSVAERCAGGRKGAAEGDVAGKGAGHSREGGEQPRGQVLLPGVHQRLRPQPDKGSEGERR